jgi:hypothetical protein
MDEDRTDWKPEDYKGYLRHHFDTLSGEDFNMLANECNERFGTEL